MLLALVAALAAAPLQADLHLDTPTQLYRKDLPFDATDGLEGSLARLEAGGTNLAVQVLWPPRKVDHKAHSFMLLERLNTEVDRLDALVLVRTPEQARAAAAAGRVGILVSLEGAHGLGDGAWRPVLDTLHDGGLGMLGLTWSISNRFAGSSSDGGGGLTDEGQALLLRARELGLVIDLSHASRAATLEVCGSSPVPVIASHSNAAAIASSGRNLSDEELRCIGATGGVIGLNLHGPFVGGERTVAQLADHAEHIAKVAGFGAVALGSDFDGLIKPVQGIAHAGELDRLWQELAARGWTEAQIVGARGENFMRAWTAVLAGAKSGG